MTTAQVQTALRRLGWPIAADGAFGPRTFEAVQDFQRGFAFWNLLVDGYAGPNTHRALAHSVGNGGRCSLHFAFGEFASRGNGWIRVHRALVRGLEDYRELVRRPVAIASGYRDHTHNRRVGGVPDSQHLYGNAADVEPRAGATAVRRLARFSGIGLQRATGLVNHVDVRHLGPNPTRGTLRDPTIWLYD